MKELDPVCLTGDQEAHGIHIHEHHLFEVEGRLAWVAMQLGYDLRHVLRVDATDEAVHRRPVIARRLDPERHWLASQFGPEMANDGPQLTC
jgi:hypothetical protein